MEATRERYGKILAEIGKDENIVVLDADLSGSTKTGEFGKKYPDRFFNMGISEANMVGVASGLAASGKTVFASSFASFLMGRSYDQIRQSICYSNMPIKLVSTHAGLTLGEDGATHQMLEDIGLAVGLPNMDVYTASTPKIAEIVIRKIKDSTNPTYLRLYRAAVSERYEGINDEELKDFFEKGIVGKGVENTEIADHDILLITCGDLIDEVYTAKEKLERCGIKALVLDVIRLKPFNEEMLINIVREMGNTPIITIEDHSIYGGLGSIVCLALSRNLPRKVCMMGTTEFGKSGKPKDLLKKYGLDADSILSMAKNELKK